MRDEKEIRELVETLDGLIDTMKEIGSATLTKIVLPNTEAFKDVLLWVLEEDQTSGGSQA